MEGEFNDIELKSLFERNYKIVQELNKRASMFSKPMLVLSLLDVVFGILAFVCSSLQIAAIFFSLSSLTAIKVCGKIIQANKVAQLEKSLRTFKWISVAWFVNKYEKSKKGSKIKMTKSTKLQKILTTILAIFGVGGVVVGFLPQFAPIAQNVSMVIAMISEGIATASGLVLAGTSDKVLTDEEKAKIEEENAKKEKAKKDAEVAKAKAELERLKALEKLVAEAEAENTTEIK